MVWVNHPLGDVSGAGVDVIGSQESQWWGGLVI